MSKYAITWIEWHDPANHPENPNLWLETLPNAVHTADADDGWQEYEASIYFEADNDEAAKAKAREIADNPTNGVDEIFSLTAQHRGAIATEETLWETANV